LTLRILSTPITGSSLARIAIEGGDGSWFVRRPASADEWKERSRVVRDSLLAPNWLAEIEPAIRATGAAAKRLRRAAKSGIVVTAGQQPALFGGPLYTWWKALSAVAFADRLEEMTGLPVVPIYWAATDDSDFAEARYTVVQSAAGAERIEMRGDPAAGTPMSDVPLGDISSQLDQLFESAGSASTKAVLETVRRAYSPGHTVGSAYLELLREMLEPLGVPVLDAAHVSIRTAGYPILRKALEQAERIEQALADRESEITNAGHSTQVRLVKGRTLVFSGYGGTRDRVRIRDVRHAIEDGAPDYFGPNVLLRPVVERSIIPTVAYIGGPAEIAYFAQATAVAQALDVPPPLIIPRWSGMVVEQKIEKILARHGLTVEEFRDPHAVETRIANDSLPAPLKDNLGALAKSFDQATARLADSEGADLIPSSVFEGLRHNFSHRLERIERRFRASVKRRGNDALRDVATARGALFPFGVPQERALNIVPLLARHGDALISGVMEEARLHARTIL
jgi:bacillithiol biosynthesis cysteine-adding enzyme BshC